MDRRRVGVFGGSFNPVHVSHVLAVTYVLLLGEVDDVLVVPVFMHPFSKELASFDDRLAMCRLALGWVPGVFVSTVERELGGESKTLRTVETLAEQHPEWDLRLVIGADVVLDLPKWHQFDRIAEIAPPLVIGRAGVAAEAVPHALTLDPDAPRLPAISSTLIREAIARGDRAYAAARLPRQVLAFIEAHGLYRELRGDAGDGSAS